MSEELIASVSVSAADLKALRVAMSILDSLGNPDEEGGAISIAGPGIKKLHDKVHEMISRRKLKDAAGRARRGGLSIRMPIHAPYRYFTRESEWEQGAAKETMDMFGTDRLPENLDLGRALEREDIVCPETFPISVADELGSPRCHCCVEREAYDLGNPERRSPLTVSSGVLSGRVRDKEGAPVFLCLSCISSDAFAHDTAYLISVVREGMLKP